MSKTLEQLSGEFVEFTKQGHTENAISIISQITQMGPNAIMEATHLNVPLIIYAAIYTNENILQTLINAGVDSNCRIKGELFFEIFVLPKFRFYSTYSYNILDIAILFDASPNLIERLIEDNPQLPSKSTLQLLEDYPYSNRIMDKIFEKTEKNSNIKVQDAISSGHFDLAKLLINKGALFDPLKLNIWSPSAKDNGDLFVESILFLTEIGVSTETMLSKGIIRDIIEGYAIEFREIPQLYDLLVERIEQIGGVEHIISSLVNFDGNGDGSHEASLLGELYRKGVKFLDSHFKYFYFMVHEYSDEPLSSGIFPTYTQYSHPSIYAIIDFFVLIGLDPAKIDSGTMGKSIEEMNPNFFTDAYYLNLFARTNNLEYVLNLIYMRPDIILPKLDESFIKWIRNLDDINIQNRDGNTLMHLALHFKRADIADAISTKLVNLDIQNNAGETAQSLLDALKSDKDADSALVEQFTTIFTKNIHKINESVNDMFLRIHKSAWAKAAELAKSSLGAFKVISEKITPKITKSESSFAELNQHGLFGLLSKFIGIDQLNDFNKNLSFSNSPNSNIITHDVAHDGNCFFHVLAANTDLTHGEIRAGAVAYIREHLNEFEGFTEENINYYIDNMSLHGTWADHLIIQAVANHFQWSIEILNADHALRTMITPIGIEATQNIIAIYTGDNHYHAGYRIASPEEEEIAETYNAINTENANESSNLQSGNKRKHKDTSDSNSQSKKAKNSEEFSEEEDSYENYAIESKEPEPSSGNPGNNSTNSYDEFIIFGDIILNFSGSSESINDM
ncbi:MAG: hypothetical protein WBJ81_03430 [Rickettsiales bacterium]